MINKKTIAVKQDVKGLITRGISDMTPAEPAKIQLAVSQVLASRTLPGFLGQIGRVHEVPFSDGRKTLSVILTYEGIRSLGIDLNTAFKGCGGREEFNVETDVKYGSTIQQAHGSPQDGVLVNLDLYQQVALLKAIIAKKHELQDTLGLYNLRGARKVYEALSRAGVPQQLNIWWMWTADRFVLSQSEVNYPEEGIVTLSELPTLKGYRFAHRNIDNDYWSSTNPDNHYNHGAAVFGAQG